MSGRIKRQGPRVSAKTPAIEEELDPNTVASLSALAQAAQNARSQMQLVIQTVINAKGLEGTWSLTPDGKKLVQVSDGKS